MASIQNKVKQAFENATPNVLDSVLSDCVEKNTDVVPMTVKKPRLPILRFAATAAILVLLVGLGAMAASLFLILGPARPSQTVQQPLNVHSEAYRQLVEEAWAKISNEPFGSWYSEGNPYGDWRAYTGNILFYSGGQQKQGCTTMNCCGALFSHTTSFRLFYFDYEKRALIDLSEYYYFPEKIQEAAIEHAAYQEKIFGKDWMDQYPHNYRTEILLEATCTNSGQSKDKCTDCGYSRCQDIPATGHTWNSLPDGSRKCTACGLIEVAHEHVYALYTSSDGNKDRPKINTFKCKVCNDLRYAYVGTTGTYDLNTLQTELEEYARSQGFSPDHSHTLQARLEDSCSTLFRVLENAGGYSMLKQQGFDLIDSICQRILSSDTDASTITIRITYLEDAEHTVGAFRIYVSVQ